MTCRDSRKPLTCSSTTDTVLLSAQSLGGETIFLLKLHRKVLVTHAKVPSPVLMLPGAAPGGVDANGHFEKPPSFNYSTIPPSAVGLEHDAFPQKLAG